MQKGIEMSDTTKVLLELPDELHRELKSKAALAGIPLYQIMIEILQQAIKIYQKDAA
jgi:predicted HicB family RNase H-like nuclease